MKAVLYITALMAVSLLSPRPLIGQTTGRTPVIIELFTSEGCDTCPPADKYIEKLLHDQPVAGAEIIPLALHVDYWNRLGWTDPFSSAVYSRRQNYYADFFKLTEIYTPQMVVNGTRELSIRDGLGPLRSALKDPRTNVSLAVSKEEGSTLTLNVDVGTVEGLSSEDQAFVVVAITEDALTSNVLRGENSGKKLGHVGVVRILKMIGSVGGQETKLSTSVELGKDWKRENLSAVAFVQMAKGRRILGAAKLSLSK